MEARTSNDLTAEELLKFRKHFKEVYSGGKEVNPIPEGVPITAFCDDGKEDVGFVCDVLAESMGIEIFIVKSWILESELQELINV